MPLEDHSPGRMSHRTVIVARTLSLSYDDLAAAVGMTLGPSDSLGITQARINMFAEATEDQQWIHTNVVRAAAGPFGTTIAHGYLTLSLVAAFLDQVLSVTGVERVINYGSDRVRYPSPLPVGSDIRASGEIRAVKAGDGWTQLEIRVVITADAAPRPACVADVLLRYYPTLAG